MEQSTDFLVGIGVWRRRGGELEDQGFFLVVTEYGVRSSCRVAGKRVLRVELRQEVFGLNWIGLNGVGLENGELEMQGGKGEVLNYGLGLWEYRPG